MTPTVRRMVDLQSALLPSCAVLNHNELSGKSVTPIPAATKPFNASISSPTDVIFGRNPADLQASTATLCKI